jgi:hypothetical protein
MRRRLAVKAMGGPSGGHRVTPTADTDSRIARYLEPDGFIEVAHCSGSA